MSQRKDLIPVRLSHLLGFCTVGTILRGPDYLLTVKDIRYWTDRGGGSGGEPIRYVDRVRSALGITQELREPPLARELDNGQIDGVCVPALRFPFWMYCSNERCTQSGLLHYKPWRDLEADEYPQCATCRRKLEQVPWVMIHAAGYMADVPWHYLTHIGARSPEQKQCRADWTTAYLKLTKPDRKREIRCTRCQASASFDDSARIPYGLAWPQPWEKGTVELPEEESLAEILEINDVRVHSPINHSALVIPPESRVRKGSVVDRLYRSSLKQGQIRGARTALARKAAMAGVASEFRCQPADIESALAEIDRGYPGYGQNITSGQLLEGEYQAFLEELSDMADDEDFVTQHQSTAWKALAADHPQSPLVQKIIAAVSHLIVVKRLKEIRVLQGFRRLSYDESVPPVPPDLVGESDWLPALELYGEGLFFTLDEAWVQGWEVHDACKQRAEAIQRRFSAAPLHFEPEITPTPRFLLLHTLAHLLIRQLEARAGYPAASLKERIYCGGKNFPMAGILIYVAGPDKAGSLGGLAELAEAKRFLPLLASVFDHAQWCSLDPVCSEHEGQGPNQLNRAACHGCALIPEPACIYRNVLLDRSFIKGDATSGLPAFLSLDS